MYEIGNTGLASGTLLREKKLATKMSPPVRIDLGTSGVSV